MTCQTQNDFCWSYPAGWPRIDQLRPSRTAVRARWTGSSVINADDQILLSLVEQLAPEHTDKTAFGGGEERTKQTNDARRPPSHLPVYTCRSDPCRVVSSPVPPTGGARRCSSVLSPLSLAVDRSTGFTHPCLSRATILPVDLVTNGKKRIKRQVLSCFLGAVVSGIVTSLISDGVPLLIPCDIM
jgi:hypothetical protein